MIRISVILFYPIADKLLIIKVATVNPSPLAFLRSIIGGIAAARQLDCFHIPQRRKNNTGQNANLFKHLVHKRNGSQVNLIFPE